MKEKSNISQGVSLKKDPWLFAQSEIEPRDVLSYFLSLGSELDASYLVDHGKTLDTLLIKNNLRKKDINIPSTSHKNISVIKSVPR